MTKKTVVLGGGIAGVEAAISLSKWGFDVELVSERDYLLNYPLAIWVPTGGISLKKTNVPLAGISRAHRFKLTIDTVTGISAASKSFSLENAGERFDFDYLVVALGAHKANHKGKEHVFSICGPPEEIAATRDRLQACLARRTGKIAIGFGGNPKDSSGVRGGPAFEFLFNVHHTLKKRGLRKNFELTLFAPMAKPGVRLGEKALGMMDAMLSALNIAQRTGVKIAEFVSDGVVFEDGTKLDSDMTMFISACDGHTVVKSSDLPQNDAGFVTTSSACEVSGYPWLYAVGDVAALEGPDWKAKQGHLAEEMSRVAAHDIAVKEGKAAYHKSYLDHLCILCVMDMGNGAALVYRDRKRSALVPMPIVGHWLKNAWGVYYRLSKLGKIPRIPGM
jgi:sulfide:quinone oxidoreductase